MRNASRELIVVVLALAEGVLAEIVGGKSANVSTSSERSFRLVRMRKDKRFKEGRSYYSQVHGGKPQVGAPNLKGESQWRGKIGVKDAANAEEDTQRPSGDVMISGVQHARSSFALNV